MKRSAPIVWAILACSRTTTRKLANHSAGSLGCMWLSWVLSPATTSLKWVIGFQVIVSPLAWAASVKVFSDAMLWGVSVE